MKVLVVGGGGREHALVWKIAQSKKVRKIFCAPGNAGIGKMAECVNIKADRVQDLLNFARFEGIDLTVVGPEAPLTLGIVDLFEKEGKKIFGVSRAAAELEGSKVFSKDLMRRYNIPSAEYKTFYSPIEAENYVRLKGAPIVVKADGLAAGKGAIVCMTVEEAVAAAHSMLAERVFGAAGQEVVVEEYLEGEELSVFALSDGESVLPMLPAQDHKRAGEGDTGPNTGGMGAYAPVALGTGELLARVRDEILAPTVRAMRDDGRPFRGLLYGGLIVTTAGPKVIESTARFGDRETEVVLPLLASSLLDPLLEIARGGRLGTASLTWKPETALTTVLASAGYPGPYERGKEILVPGWVNDADDVVIFHMGTRVEEGRLVTAGGRVLAATAVAPTIEAAAARSREMAEAIRFEGKQYRGDIGWREVARRAGAA